MLSGDSQTKSDNVRNYSRKKKNKTKQYWDSTMNQYSKVPKTHL